MELQVGTIIICIAMSGAFAMIVAARAISQRAKSGERGELPTRGLDWVFRGARVPLNAIVHGTTALLLVSPAYLFLTSAHDIAANIVRWRSAPGFDLHDSAILLVGASVSIAAIALASRSSSRMLSHDQRIRSSAEKRDRSTAA